jgi:hypothetical protein
MRYGMTHLLLELRNWDGRPSVGWGLSRLSAYPDTRNGHQPSLVRRCFQDGGVGKEYTTRPTPSWRLCDFA